MDHQKKMNMDKRWVNALINKKKNHYEKKNHIVLGLKRQKRLETFAMITMQIIRQFVRE